MSKTNGKILELTFLTETGGTVTLSVPNPQEGLSLTTVNEKAAKLIPVLVSSAGTPVVSLKKARIIETTATDLQ